MIPSRPMRKCPPSCVPCAAAICWSTSVSSNPSFLFRVSIAAKGFCGSGSSPVGLIRAACSWPIVTVPLDHEASDSFSTMMPAGTRNDRCVSASGSAASSTRAGRYLK